MANFRKHKMELRSPLTLQPYDYISDINGRPLIDGKIYIGESGKDPEFYPIPVFLDAEMTKAVDQPIRTKGGFADFSADFAEIYASPEIYSIKVLDSLGRKVLYKENMTRKNLMSDALADLNQAIIDAQTAAQNTLDATVSGVNTTIENTVSDANEAISIAVQTANAATNNANTAVQNLFENGGLPATPFSNYADMIASALVDNDYAVVTNDSDLDKNGVYQKQSGTWVFSSYNPIAQSKAYVDSTLAPLNKISINSGKNYPLKSLPRNNVVSPPRVELNNALLDVKIYGASPDHYYRIAYIKNGLTSLGDYPYGVQIDEMPITGYETSSVATSRIIDYIDPAPNLPRGGVQTQVIKSPRQPDFEVHLTFDTDKLPPVGSFINLKDAGNAAWSWVVDPSNYTYVKQRTGVYYKVDNDLNISFEYQSGLYYYRVTFGKNGFNNLPNIRKIERCVANRSKVWATVSETDTDYLPPLVFNVINNGDVDATKIYTGGNHGTSGAAGGNQTARNVYYKIAVDGQELSAGSSGYAASVDLFIINELMAYNTVSTARYAIRQTFKVELKKAQVIVNADIHALEDIEISTDNGLQLYTGGYQGTQIIVGGQDQFRVNFKDKINSGLKVNAPNAFALVLHSGFDQLAVWMDREYGAGDTRYIPNSATLIRAGSGTNTKWYNAIIANTAQQITANSSYKWRGGYSIERKASITGYDSAFSKDDGFVSVVDASNYTVID